MAHNPFSNRSMITSSDDFFGRRDIVEALLGRVVHVAKPQCVALVGQRRIGKSSLFRQVERGIAAQSPATVVAYFDLEAASGLSTDRFFTKLLRRLDRAAAVSGDGELSPFERFEEFLEDGEQAGRRHVLLLDEFDTVTLNPAFDASFFGSLRYLASNYSLAFLTSSYDELALLCHTDEVRQSPFFNIFTSMDLSFMAGAEVDELLDTLIARGGNPFTSDERAWVLEHGAGFPFFVQIAASAVWEEKRAGRPGLGEATRRRLAEESAPHFRYFVKHLDPDHRRALELLVAGGRPPAPLQRGLARRSLVHTDSSGKPRPFSPALAAYLAEDRDASSQTTVVAAAAPPRAGDELAPGMMVAERFLVEHEVGRGGFGTVFRAIDTTLRRPVALKSFLARGLGGGGAGEQVKAKALKEARAAARLSHPGIVTVFDVLDWHGSLLIAMEFVDGQTLSRFLRLNGPLPSAQAAGLAAAALEALDAAHRLGVVHRDIKPGNIMLDESGRVRVMDFGLVRNVQPDPASASSSGVSGTPNYMAPEQLRGELVDHRADIFSFGVMLYELVSCRRPFEGSTLAELTKQILFDAPPELSVVAPTVDARYAGLAMSCLEKDPGARPSAEQLLRGLKITGSPSTDTSMNRAERAEDVKVHPGSSALGVEESSPSLTSRLVQQAARGDKAALERVMSAVYLELRDRARAVRRKGPRGSMQTGSLIHEAFLKMVKQDGATLKDRAHFIAIATIQMRRVLLDHARARRAGMRGGGAARVELTEVAVPADAMGGALGGHGSGEQRLVDSVDLDRCLTRLEKASPQAGQVVSMRILGGASMEDIAEVMGVTRQTVHKHWKVGQAWLAVCLKRDGRRS